MVWELPDREAKAKKSERKVWQDDEEEQYKEKEAFHKKFCKREIKKFFIWRQP